MLSAVKINVTTETITTTTAAAAAVAPQISGSLEKDIFLVNESFATTANNSSRNLTNSNNNNYNFSDSPLTNKDLILSSTSWYPPINNQTNTTTTTPSIEEIITSVDNNEEDGWVSTLPSQLFKDPVSPTTIATTTRLNDSTHSPSTVLSTWYNISTTLTNTKSLNPLADTILPKDNDTIELTGYNLSLSSISLYTNSTKAFNNDGLDFDIALTDNAATAPFNESVYMYNGSAGVKDVDSINQSFDYERNTHQQQQQNESLHRLFDGVHNGNILLRDDLNGANSFMLLLEDFGEYFYSYNGSTISSFQTSSTLSSLNLTNFDYSPNCTTFGNLTNLTSSRCYDDSSEVVRNYWALILIVFPIFTLFGNILVILSVIRERSLQTVTNYFIVSLAIADLLVAVVVMPFGVYALVNVTWGLPYFACDFYIAMDVICSTSSIFNLVAISVDRYIAVTQPIKYAKHRNSRRVCLTIVMVWAISAAIGSPIVLGLNNTPNRDPSLCMFYNTDFIVYSSLSSFYIPCIIMVFLYWNIFKALRSRARKQRAARKPPNLSEMTGGSVIENVAQTRKLAETALGDSVRQQVAARIMPDEPATNTGSGSNEEDEENVPSPDVEDCHVIVNDKSTEFMLATVVEETGNVVAQITSQPQLMVADTNGNHDSGYAPSNVDDVLAGIAEDSSPPDSPAASGTTVPRSTISSRRDTDGGESLKCEPTLSAATKSKSLARHGVQEAMTLARHDSTISATSKSSSRKDKKSSQSSRFTIYKVHKPSKKKREKSSAKKERKATKTLAIVLGVFLFCWLPFFSCNIMDAMCSKFDKDCSPGVTAFIFTTWLGYINSFVNPVIYTIFNPEFRKAFKKIMHMG